MRNEHHHWSLMFADERTRDLNIFLKCWSSVETSAPSLSFVRIKYWPRAEEEITLEEIPCLKCSIFGLNMLVYILNTLSLYFITRVAFLVIVRLKIDFKIHVIIMMDCGSIRQSFQIIIAIPILWRVKTYDDNISDSCWFNFATIIMENLTMIYLP